MTQLASTNIQSHAQREFPMMDEDFELIQNIAYQYTGIRLSDHKKEMVYSRLVRRIRRLGLADFQVYCELITQPDNVEVNEFINAITTNLTGFFREPHHFDYLKQQIIPYLKQKHAKDKRIRIWCAAASTGEEPYSLSIAFYEVLNVAHWDVKILATDLDSNVLETAKTGIYDEKKIIDLSENRKQKWFRKPSNGMDPEMLKVTGSLKRILYFKRLNLLESWPMSGPFDVIFCRNVVIYFDKETQKILFDRIADILSPQGYLFIGHSENLYGVTQRFESLGGTIYRKKF